MTQEPTNPGCSGQDRPRFIYVVDDEKLVAELVETILKLEQYETCIFHDPQEALNALVAADPKPDLMLTDYVMEGMNGMELIQRAKAIKPELRTVLYSGSMDSNMLQHFEVKPDKFLGKPFLPKALTETINSALVG